MTIIEMTVTGAMMILGVIVIRAVTVSRLPKRVFIIMWEIALMRLILPISVPVKMLPAVQTPVLDSPPIYDSVAEPIWNDIVLSIPEEVREFIPSGSPAAVTVPASPAADTPSFTVTPQMIWIAGAVGLAVFFAISYLSGIRRFRNARQCDSDFIRGWLLEHPIERPLSVKVSRSVSSPLTYGFLNPVILIPPEYENADEQSLGFVLEHEFAHIRHFDALKKLVCAAALCVHWFNPLMWVLYLLYNRDMELWCDESVIKKFGAKSKAHYARLLISIEEQRSAGVPLLSHFGKSTTEERIVSIMKFKKATFITICSAVLLVAAITVTIIATSVNPIPKDPEPTKDLSNISNVSATEPDEDELIPENGELPWNAVSESEIDNYVISSGDGLTILDNGSDFYFEEGEEIVFSIAMTSDHTGRLIHYGYHIGDELFALGKFSDLGTSSVFTVPKTGYYQFYAVNMSKADLTVRGVQVSRQTAPLHTDANLYNFEGPTALGSTTDTLRFRRQVSTTSMDQIHDIVTNGVSNMDIQHFEKGDRAIVVYDFGHPVTEDEMKFTAGFIKEECGDHGENPHSGIQTRYSLENSFVYDETCLVFTFIAPDTADYFFHGGTAGKPIYVAGAWVEVETDTGVFGNIRLTDNDFEKHLHMKWESLLDPKKTIEQAMVEAMVEADRANQPEWGGKTHYGILGANGGSIAGYGCQLVYKDFELIWAWEPRAGDLYLEKGTKAVAVIDCFNMDEEEFEKLCDLETMGVYFLYTYKSESDALTRQECLLDTRVLEYVNGRGYIISSFVAKEDGYYNFGVMNVGEQNVKYANSWIVLQSENDAPDEVTYNYDEVNTAVRKFDSALFEIILPSN